MSPQDQWLPPWFKEWLTEVYHPAHAALDSKMDKVITDIKTIQENGMSTASAVQNLVLGQQLREKRRSTVIGFVKEWANPLAIAALIVAMLVGGIIRVG